MNLSTLRQGGLGRPLPAAGAVALVLALLFLTGCSTAAPAATSTPTKTLMPTFTPAPPTATATDVPPTATATEISQTGRSGIYDVRVSTQTGQVIAEFRGISRAIKGQLFDEDADR